MFEVCDRTFQERSVRFGRYTHGTIDALTFLSIHPIKIPEVILTKFLPIRTKIPV